MTFSPSTQQRAIFDAIAAGDHNILVDAKAGSGKCLAAGTPVLMFDGSIRRVETITTSDFVMGEDGFPKAVLSTTKGIGQIVRVTPVKGDSWMCNDVHVLTLVNSVGGEVFDCSIDEYRKNAGRQRWKDAKLFRVSVEFREQPTTLEPYLVGLWLGDGHTDAPIITADETEIEIINYCKEIAPCYGQELMIAHDKRQPNVLSLRFRVGSRGVAGRNTPNHVWRGLQVCRQDGKKRIPTQYLINSRERRLDLLAGLIDTDGYYSGGLYEIVAKSPYLAHDILYLTRSLGLAAYNNPKTVNNVEYNRITISGNLDEVPCRVPRKQAEPRTQIKDVLRTGFKLTNCGLGEYYGFTLSGDGRFLLGDFTVTHNTTTIVEGMKYIPQGSALTAPDVAFLAFNKNIAETLKFRCPRNVLCSTFHSLGFRALKDSNIVDRSVKVDGTKCRKILYNIMEYDDEDFRDVLRLISLLKSSVQNLAYEDIDPRDLLEFHGLDFIQPERAITAALRVLKTSDEQTDVIDFDDMLHLAVKFNAFFQPRDWIFVDEAQDLNGIQHEIVARLCRQASNASMDWGGDRKAHEPESSVFASAGAVAITVPSTRCVAVGDPHQAIYGFRGAHSDSMSVLAKRFAMRTYPLSVSYRCPKAVVKEAQRVLS